MRDQNSACSTLSSRWTRKRTESWDSINSTVLFYASASKECLSKSRHMVELAGTLPSVQVILDTSQDIQGWWHLEREALSLKGWNIKKSAHGLSVVLQCFPAVPRCSQRSKKGLRSPSCRWKLSSRFPASPDGDAHLHFPAFLQAGWMAGGELDRNSLRHLASLTLPCCFLTKMCTYHAGVGNQLVHP